MATSWTIQPEGYGIDRRFPDVLYVPEDAVFNMNTKTVSWDWDGKKPFDSALGAKRTYILPNGYKMVLSHTVGARGGTLKDRRRRGPFVISPAP
jgi:hypothetical protein